MTISRELFLALLSLDTYYRGKDGAGKDQNVIATSGVGQAQGDWLYSPSANLPSWDSTSFNATVYTLSGSVAGISASTVIAYRGTDDLALSLSGVLSNGLASDTSDIYNGWSVGAGNYAAPQAQQAVDLYEQVSGALIGQGNAADIELTGHSLGGGLAGFVSALSGSRAIGYDHMPFMLASTLASNLEVLGQVGKAVETGTLANLSVDDIVATFSAVKVPNFDNFQGISVDGEMLQPARELYSTKFIVDAITGKAEDLVKEMIESALNVVAAGLGGPVTDDLVDLVYMGLGNVLDGYLGNIPLPAGSPAPTLSELADKVITFASNMVGENSHQTVLDDYGWDPVGYEALSGILEVLQPLTGYFSTLNTNKLNEGELLFGRAGVGGSIAIAVGAVLVDFVVNVSAFVNNTVFRFADSVIKHDASTLVLLQFAKDNDAKYANWHAGVDLKLGDLPDIALTALSSGPVGAEALANSAYLSFNGAAASTPNTLLRTGLAYSVLDSGDRPFGDTAAHAYFNDLDELGQVLQKPNLSTLFQEDSFNFFGLFEAEKLNTTLTLSLVRIAAQYAGALAFNGVQEDTNSNVDSRQGVLTISGDDKTLALDMSSILWKDVLASGRLGGHGGYQGSESLAIDSQGELIAGYFSRNNETSLWWGGLLGLETVNTDELNRLAGLVWQGDVGILDRIHFATEENATDITLPERSYTVTTTAGTDTHVDVYVGVEVDETVHGTSGNDFIATGDGDDTIYGGTGRDLVLAGAGTDTIVDNMAAPDRDGRVRNEGDVYVGDPVEGGLMENFSQFLTLDLSGLFSDWLDVDTVHYSMALPGGGYASKGVTVVAAAQGKLDTDETIELSIRDENTGQIATDSLIEIEKVVLTERADKIEVTPEMRAAPVWIDMGLGVPNGSFGKADYDEVSYLKAGTAVITVNGATQPNNQPNPSLSGVSYLSLISDLVGAAVGVPTSAMTLFEVQSNDSLRVTGAEKITLSSGDDIAWYGDIGAFTSVITGWPKGDDYPHFGEINGDAGNDLIVVRDPEYIFAGAPIDPDVADSPNAATDLRLEVKGGEGEDRLMVVGGTGAIVSGGAGKDFLFNWSYKGQMYGDGLDGTGGDDDIFWWSVGSFIMDAERGDRLQMFGIPLTGGTSYTSYTNNQAVDWFLPFVRYAYTGAGQLIVSFGDPSTVEDVLSTAMVVNDYDFGAVADDPGFSNFSVADIGDLGMTFRIYADGGKEISVWAAMWGHLMSFIQALQIFAKSLSWDTSDDPLILDLDGDGIETTSVDFGVHFDLDNDSFAQLSGWVNSDDGLLVRDLNGNGRIDDGSELFGSPTQGALAMLATLDSNADGWVDVLDTAFGSLRVWRDLDQDGQTDAGELKTLADTGISRLGTSGSALNLTAANGNQLLAEATIQFSDGHTGKSYEAIFDTNPVDTVYAQEAGKAAWAGDIDSRGYGKLAQLATAATNDFAVAAVLKSTADAMATPDMEVLRQQAQPVFEAWANALADSRELAPVLLNSDGSLRDRGVYAEDASGGYWQLASGASVRAADGSAIARPTLEQVLAQADAAGGHWQLEQLWSPAERLADPAVREEAPYLVRLQNGRAVVLDHGVLHTDAAGSWWTLASGAAILGANGQAIARAQLADVLASSHATGTEWRVEDFAVQPAPFPFAKTAVYFKGGLLTDYAVQVTDSQGSFFVWANNLRLALAYQEQNGVNGFGLRNYALDLDHLKDADNSTDSYVRAEIVSAAQLKFAAAAYGIVIEPDILVATTGANGVLQYSAPIDDTVEFMDQLMEHYSFFSRAAALHLAAQGGLADFFRGVQYDAAADAWVTTSGRELVDIFEAIFEHAPDGREPTAAYLEKWGEIMNVIYADLHTHNGGAKTQDWVLQQVLAAWQNVPTDVELLKAAEAFGVDEEAIIQHDAAATLVNGTGGDDLFILSEGDQSYKGGLGHDVYIVGKNFGHDLIEDTEAPLGPRAPDLLRFAHLKSTDVYAYKDGIDLVIEVKGSTDVLTVRNQFEGKLPSLFGGDLSADTEMVQISFADGVVWDKLDIAWATSHPLDSDDLVLGTPEIDVLDGGRGNDILRGGRESDYYIFDVGYGKDRVQDSNDNILVTHYDLLQFGKTLDAQNLKFSRVADSLDLVVSLVDDNGHLTGDQVTVVNQFWAINTWVFGVQWLDRIERFVFGSGSFLTEADVMRMTLEQAKTDGEDAIFGFHAVDKVDGGKGNDYLSGGDEGDNYVFGLGYGHDVIEDNQVDFFSSSYDTLQLGSGISAANVQLVRNGAEQSVTLVVAGTEDKLTLTNEFRLTSTILFGDYYFDSVDEVRFADGSVWDMDTLARMLLDQARTSGDDTIYGFDRNDELDGGAGNDRLEGGSYSDTYIYHRGWGNDTIFDESTGFFLDPGFDTLDMSDVAFDDIRISRFKEDLIFTIKDTGETLTLSHQYNRFDSQGNAVEVFKFGDQTVSYQDLNPEDVDLIGTAGDDTLWGTHFAETIDGRAGNDLMMGSSDGDSYRFDVGYGNDTILDLQESRAWLGPDRVIFGGDITVENVIFSKDGNDLVVTIANRPDTLRISQQFSNTLAGVELFQFHDGTVWTISDVEELLLIAGGGRGDDVIRGLSDQDNILDGRQGDDQLFGGRGADTYLFGVGYGQDTVTEVFNAQAFSGAVDKVFFGSLVEPEALLASRDGGDLLFTLPESGDQLRIVNGLDQRLVEEFHFGNGTVWTLAEVRLAMLRGTDGDDQLTGFDDSADTLAGGRGSDELQGALGSDAYRFNLGDGADAIADTGGEADRVAFGPLITAGVLQFAADGDNLVIHFTGTDDSLVLREVLGADDAARRVEEFRFEDGFAMSFDAVRQALIDQQATAGADIVTGFTDRDDRLQGAAGADELVGLGGGDTYVFDAGSGADIVDDRGRSLGDRIVFNDYQASQALVRRAHPASSDLLIRFAGSSDQVLVKGALDDGGDSAIEAIQFADGTAWTVTDLRNQVLADAVSAGDDVVNGFAGVDRIEAGRGDDVVNGLAGADTYVFSLGDGHDLLRDSGTGADVDVLQIEGYVPSDVKVLRPHPDRPDLLLVLGDNGDEILLRDQMSTAAGTGIEQVKFGDGTVWSRTDLVSRISAGGTASDDAINGGSSGEFIIGRGGNDRLSGGDGSDTYVFTRGDGRDTIEDNGFFDTDVVRLVGYTPAQVQLSRALDAPATLLLRFAGSADELRVVNTLASDPGDQIERFEFEDGTVWTIEQVKAMLVVPANPLADNTITGLNSDDTLAGGLGSDTLVGADGSDTYLYRRNDGNDTVQDQGFFDTDRIRLQGYTPAEVSVSMALESPNTLELRFAGNQDVLRIVNTLGFDANDSIEQIVFDDGTVWTMDTVRALLVAAQQSSGNDRISAFAGDDAINPGAGDDSASGNDGSDTYTFSRGDGRDSIDDNGFFDTDTLRLRGYTPAEVSIAQAQESAATLVLRFAGTADEVRLLNTLSFDANDTIEQIVFDDGTVWTMDQVRARLVAQQQTAGANGVVGFAGDDAINPGLGDDSASGADGSDTYSFSRGDGRDSIDDNGFFDTDVLRLRGYTPAEVSIAQAQDSAATLVLRFAGTADEVRILNTLNFDANDTVEQIVFDDGTVWTMDDVRARLLQEAATAGNDSITGFPGDDSLGGGNGGNDLLSGADGSDSYVFAPGMGADRIDENGFFDTDTIRLQGVLPAAVSVERLLGTTESLVLRLTATGDTLTVLNTLDNDANDQIEQVVFDDGTVWTIAQIKTMLAALPALPTTAGTNAANTLEATATPSLLQGQGGNDSYLWTRGDGDTVVDDGAFQGTADLLRLQGVAVSAVQLQQFGADVLLSIAASAAGAGDAARIMLKNGLDSGAERGVEQIVFDDGTVWTQASLRALLMAAQQSAGNDIITGYGPAETLQGGRGNDSLAGGGGNDTYIYQRGDGEDVVTDPAFAGNADVLRLQGVAVSAVQVQQLGADAVLTIAESAPGAGDAGRIVLKNSLDSGNEWGVEQIVFDDGTVWTQASLRGLLMAAQQTGGNDSVSGYSPAETLQAGRGNDSLAGGGGNDTYIYQRGDGEDVVTDPAFAGSADVLRLQGVAVSAVQVQQVGADAVLTIAESAPGAGDAGRIVLKNGLDSGNEWGVEQIVFDDGTVWTQASLRGLLLAAQQTSGNDSVSGYSPAETLQAGRGNDLMAGGGGNDSYIYQRGDGGDVVTDPAFAGSADVLRLQGVAVAAVSVQQVGADAVLNIAESAPGAGDAGRIVLKNGLDSGNEWGVEQIVFDDGTVWTQGDLRNQLLASGKTAEPTTLSGFATTDTLEGAGGDDLLVGGGGSDFYVWRRGDGNDVIVEDAFQGAADTLVLHGVDAADAALEQGDGNDLVLVIRPSTPLTGDGARIVLKNSFQPSIERGIESIVFDDGTVWNQTGFAGQALVSAATEGDDLITGSATDDRILGRGGNDLMHGGDGSDTYVLRAGDGRDQIEDNGDGDTDVVEIRGHALADARFTRVEALSNDLLIRFEGSSDTVTVINGLAGTAADGVERFDFVDAATGTVTASLTLAQVSARLVLDARSSADDQIVGTGAADRLGGGAGSDLLDGAAGDDTYEYRRGDGADRIDDTGSSTADTLSLPDFAPADLQSVRRSPPAGLDLVLRFNSGDEVVLANSLDDGATGVERITFSDGSSLATDSLRQRVLDEAATSGNEQIWGFSGADVLTGRAGSDVLHGGDGSDTYRFNAGDGQDSIEDNGNGDVDRVEIGTYTSAQVSVQRWYKGDDGVVLRFAGSTDTLTLLNTLGGSAEDGIEEIRFADGVVWQRAELLNALDNSAPVAARDGFYTVVQGRSVQLQASQLLANDFDANGDPLRIVAVSSVSHGTAALQGDGSVLFTAEAGYSGVASFQYTVSDGRSGQDTETVTLRVRPPASATDDSGLSVAEDTLLPIRVERLLANDFDGDLMVISQVLDAQHGSVTLSSTGDISFVPEADFVGAASFRYVANTPEGGRAEARVLVQVTPVNDAPVARADAGFSTAEGTPLVLNAAALLGNDSDVDGDTLSLQGVVGSANLQASIDSAGRVVLTPGVDFFGAAGFSYTVSDGHGGTAVAQATLQVTPVNDAPVLGADRLSSDEDVPVFFSVDQLLGNDSDADGDALTVTRVQSGAHGTAELFANGTILFRPQANYYGEASFSYEVSDGQGGVVGAAVTVQLNPVNDMPSANDEGYGDPGVDWLNGVEDQALAIDIARLLANDGDTDSTQISLSSVSFADHGSVAIVGNQVVFTPDAGYFGEASFHYVISDGDGGVDDALVSLFFEPTHDAPPVAGDDEVPMFEDVSTVLTMSQILANDTDIDADPLRVLWISPFSHLDAKAVKLSYDDSGNLLISPSANFNGLVTLLYEVSDGRNGSDIGKISLNVQAVNDDPVANPDSGQGTLDAPLVVRLSDLLPNDTDIDYPDPRDLVNVLHVAGVGTPSTGSISVYGGEFAVLEAPLGTSGEVSFTYTLADEAGGTDTGLVTAQIDPNHADVIAGSALRDLLIGSPTTERLEGQAGRDDLFGRGGDDVLEGGDDADLLDGGEGSDTASYSGSNIGLRADLEARIGQGGHAAGDVYVSIENLSGSAFADQLYGNGSTNRLSGQGGADLLDGRAGDDLLEGGEGDDTLVGGAGADALFGEGGSDTADYADSTQAVTVSLLSGTGLGGDAQGDTLFGIENLQGSVLGDTLEGDGQANRLAGGRGADRLIGGDGDDLLDGGRGGDVMEGGAGSDTADYAGSLSGVVVDLSGQTAGGGDAQGDSYSSIENLRGSFHDDTLRGDAGNNRIEGGEGADQIIGNGGFDTADYANAASAVTVSLASGRGTGGEAEGDTLQGIGALRGSAWNDNLGGDAGHNVFEGGTGRDTLAGAAGSDDYLFGFGGGDDTVIEAGSAADVDRVLLSADVPPSAVGLVRQGDDLIIELERGEGFLVDTLTVRNHFASADAGIELIQFDDGTQWARSDIEARSRAFSFNAQDDLIRWADEDVAYNITAARLLTNDVDGPLSGLSIVSVEAAVNGSATLLADGSVQFLGAPNFFGDAFFDYTVQDALGRQSSATAKVIVRPVNDAPTAGADGVFEGTEDTMLSIPIATLLANDADIDGDSLSVGGFGPLVDANGNYLGEVADAIFAGAATNGVVTLDFFAPNVVFIPNGDFYGAAGFSYTVNDGHGGTRVANVTLQIAAVNDDPRPQADAFATRMGTPLRMDAADLMRNDLEVEADPLSLVRVFLPENGSVEIAGNGQVLFTPTADFLGVASFSYEVSDGRGGLGTARVSINVIPLNDPPTAGNDRFDVEEDVPLVLNAAQLLTNDSDPNGDVLSISRLDAYPEKGSLAFDADGHIVFTPKANYNGDASFYYWVTDGRGEEVRATVRLTVKPDNDAPFVTDDAGPFATGEDTPLLITAAQLMANDGDPDGDLLSFGALTAEHGSLSRSGADLIFTPAADFVGTALLSYTVVDSKGAPSPTAAHFSVTVSALADVPTATPDSFNLLTGQVLATTPAALLANDKDGDGNALRFLGVSNAQHGTVEVLADGSLRFTPEAGFLGAASFDYTITDDVDGEATATVTVNVTEAQANRLPSTGVDRFQGNEDQPFSASVAALLANDSDADGDTLQFIGIEGAGEHGNATLLPGGQIVLTPDADFVGTAVFSYTVSDGIGAPVAGRIELEVPPVNDAPQGKDDVGYTVVQGNSLRIPVAELLANDVDIEGDAFSLVGFEDAFNGQVALDGADVVFTPANGYFGAAAFSYLLRDVHGAQSAAQVSLAVLPANQPPVANDDQAPSLDEDGSVEFTIASLLANDLDAEGSTLQFLGVDNAFGGNVQLLAGGVLRFSGNADFNGDASFSYRVADAAGQQDSATVRLTVRAVNDAPSAGDDEASTAEDSALTLPVLQLLGNDFDIDRGSFQLISVQAQSGGSVALDGIGNVVFTPGASFNGTAVFSYTVADLFGGEDSAQVRVSVTPVNDAPVGADDGPLSVARDGSLLINPAALLANDSDAEADALLLLAAQGALHGQLTQTADGQWRYVPDEGFVGEDQFNYTLSDGQAQAQATVRLQVFDPYAGWRQGGAGNDSFAPNLRFENKVYGAGGDDSISGGQRDDQLAGGRGNDKLFGLGGNDQIDGGDGNDSIGAGAGNDRVQGGAGNDELTGGWGADTFVFRRGDGRDVVTDFSPGVDAGPSGLSGDRLQLLNLGIAGFNDVLQYAHDTADGLLFDFGQGDTLLLRGASLASVNTDWFTFP